MTNNQPQSQSQPQPEDTILPCVQFINALCATSHSIASQFQNILNSANGTEPSPSASPSPSPAAAAATSTSVLCAPIQPDPVMDSRALDYLDEMHTAGTIDYTDYSRLFDLIQDELKCPEVIPQAPLTAALLCNLSADSAERRLYELNPEKEDWKPKARIIGVYWEPERGVRIHLSALTWVTLVTTLQVLDPDSEMCREELAEEYGEAHVVGAYKVQLMKGLKEEMYRGTLNWEGIEIFCVLTPKEVEQWNLEVTD